MPRFEPFAGVRYDQDRVALDDVIAPPYDVIGPDQLAALEARSPYNVVHVDLPQPEDDLDPYTAAGRRFDSWVAEGILRTDPEPAFYAYSMGYSDPAGHRRQIVGVLGALEVVAPGEGDVLPHEETQHKVRDDRLRILDACRADLSPVWGLSTAEGLTDLATSAAGPPVARYTDDEGVHHRLWRLTQPALVEAVAATVGSAPVVIADGHHRYATALAYRNAHQPGGGRGDADLLLALVCELADGQAGVRPIHRLVSGLPDGFDLPVALEPFFAVTPAGPTPLADLPVRMEHDGALALLVGSGQTLLLTPRVAGEGPGPVPPDAALLDQALATLPAHHLDFDHAPDSVAAKVASGQAQAGFLLRPVDVVQIATTARAGLRMPTKTTFFHPKPRTGMVFRRRLD